MFDTQYYTTDISQDKILMYQKKRIEDLEMSYVGILKSMDGLVAFGDKRSVYQDDKGISFASDTPVQKVFKGKDYLMVAYGHNMYRKGQTYDKLENLLYEYVDKYSFKEIPMKLFNKLYPLLSCGSIKEYHFLFGTILGGEMYLYEMKISHNDIFYRRIKDKACCISGGNLAFTLSNLSYHYEASSMERVKELARDCYEIAVKYGDKYSERFNPVGDGLDIATLRFEEVKYQAC